MKRREIESGKYWAWWLVPKYGDEEEKGGGEKGSVCLLQIKFPYFDNLYTIRNTCQKNYLLLKKYFLISTIEYIISYIFKI